MADNECMIHHTVPLVIESKSVTVLFVPMAGKQLEEMWTTIRKNKNHSRRLSISYSPTVTSFLLTPRLEKEGGHALIIAVHISHRRTISKIWMMLEGILILNTFTGISGIKKIIKKKKKVILSGQQNIIFTFR